MTLNSLTRDGSTGSGSGDGVNGGSVLGVGSASPQLAPTLSYNPHSAANSVLNGYATYGPTPPGPACHAYCTVTPAGKGTSRVAAILVLMIRRNFKKFIDMNLDSKGFASYDIFLILVTYTFIQLMECEL